MDVPMLMLSDDGHTLLSVRQGNNGDLELLTTPVRILQDNHTNLMQSVAAANSNTHFNQIQSSNNTLNVSYEYELISGDLINNVKVSNENENEIARSNILLNKNLQSNCMNVQETTEVSLSDSDQILVSAPSINEASYNAKKNSKKCARKTLRRSKKGVKNLDEEQAWFKCDICGQAFKKQYLLQKHVHDHAQEKPHHCPKCPASFNVPTNFTLHMASHNTGEPKCPQCGRKFARMASLKWHMVVHEVDENLYCTECEDSFETKAQLDAHIKLHNEKWSTDDHRKCKLCRKQFTQPLLYRQHLREHYKLQTKCSKQTKRGIRHRTSYKCRLCLKTFEKPSQLSRHIRVHTGEKPYKCHLCNQSFTQKGSVKIHMWQHNGVRPYSCSLCHAKFSQKGNLNTHVLRVHKAQKDTSVYRCSRCPCVFKRLGSLTGHMKRTHVASTGREESDPEPNKLDEVEEQTADGPSEEMLQANVDEVMHDLAELDSCVENSNLAMRAQETYDSALGPAIGDCSEQEKTTEEVECAVSEPSTGKDSTANSPQTTEVMLHDKMANNEKGKYIKIRQRFVNNSILYECSFCDKTFKKPSDLMRHIRIHTCDKPFKCKICGRSFTLKSTLQSHEKTHKTTVNLECRKCDLVFDSDRALDKHNRVHNSTNKCALCGKRFGSFERLKEHSKVHIVRKKQQHQNRKSLYAAEVQNLVPKVVLKAPLVLKEMSDGLLHAQPETEQLTMSGNGRPHKCSICPSAFNRLSHLKQHYRKHTGERPYTCSICDRKFTCNSALNTHIRIHDCLRPYKCPICSTHFSTLSSMKRHQFTHSNKRPYMCPYCNKTFKTTVNCRKHMKIHKQEIALQQLEIQKIQTQANLDSNQIETVIVSDQFASNNQQITAPAIVTHLTQVFSDPLSTIMKDNDKSIRQSTSTLDTPNICTTQTLHADETGTITLSNYTGDQTLTPESIREIEETLNQQLFTFGMNMGLDNTVRRIEEHNSPLQTQDQPVLSIIYDNGKSLNSPIRTSVNTNILSSRLDAFGINQISLQADNQVNSGITQTNSIKTDSIPTQLIEENQSNDFQLITNNIDTNRELHHSTLDYNKKKDDLFTVIIKEDCLVESNTMNLNNDSNLECNVCHKSGFDVDTFKEHVRKHQSNREFKCTHCLLTFCTNEDLTAHAKIHETQETHKCYECNQEFTTTLQLREHIKDHVKHELELKNSNGLVDVISDLEYKDENDISSKKNNCTYCSKTFRKPSDLVRHIRTHTGERPYQCEYCSKSFAVKCTLDAHLKVHSGEKSISCNVCNSMFATKGSLKVHMRLHTGVKPFKCTICDMRFRTSGHRKVHLLSHSRLDSKSTQNSKITPEVADLAAEVAKLENQIVQIVNVEQIPQPIHTEQLNNQEINDNQTLNTVTMNSIPNHIAFNSNNTILNDETGFVTLNENNELVANLEFLLANGLVTIQTQDCQEGDAITTHLPTANVSSNEYLTTNSFQEINGQSSGPEVIYTTEISNIAPIVTDTNNLELNNCVVYEMEHEESKLSEKNEDSQLKQIKSPSNTTRRECDICGKTFAKPCQVERHKRIHTGERPFQCDLCSKSFAQKSTLQMHQKHHTGDRPYQCAHCDRSFTQNGNLQTHLKRKHALNLLSIKRTSKEQQFVNYDPKSLQHNVLESKPLCFDDISIVDLLK